MKTDDHGRVVEGSLEKAKLMIHNPVNEFYFCWEKCVNYVTM